MHEQSVSWKDIIFMKVKTILIFIYKQLNKSMKNQYQLMFLLNLQNTLFIVLDMQENIDTQLSYKMNVVVWTQFYFSISNEHCNFSKYLIIVFVYVICQGIDNSNHGSNLFVILLHSPEIFRTKIHSPNQTLCVYYSPRMWDLGLIMR